jgi:two-component sensor histidine kinase
MSVELSMDVPRGTNAPSLARNVVEARFAPQLSAQQLADLLVIVSELTTNATLYGVGEIRLRINVENGRVYGEVVDEGSGFVGDVREQGIEEIGKRGLLIVAALAEQWGIHEGSSHVWFELAAGEDREPADPELGTEHRPAELE